MLAVKEKPRERPTCAWPLCSLALTYWLTWNASSGQQLLAFTMDEHGTYVGAGAGGS